MNYNIADINFSLPFEVIHNLTFTEKEVTLSLKIESRNVRGAFYNVDEFHVKLLIPK